MTAYPCGSIQRYKGFLKDCPSGVLDKTEFARIYKQYGHPPALASKLYLTEFSSTDSSLSVQPRPVDSTGTAPSNITSPITTTTTTSSRPRLSLSLSRNATSRFGDAARSPRRQINDRIPKISPVRTTPFGKPAADLPGPKIDMDFSVPSFSLFGETQDEDAMNQPSEAQQSSVVRVSWEWMRTTTSFNHRAHDKLQFLCSFTS